MITYKTCFKYEDYLWVFKLLTFIKQNLLNNNHVLNNNMVIISWK
jgi:hypothetical protein